MSDINITVNDEIVNIDVIDTPVLVEVTNSPGPAGAGVAAGGTTGQVLAKASNTNYDTVWVNPSTGGVPYSGATGNVNLGEYELKAGQVTLDTSPTGTAAVGTTRWNDTTGVSETTLKGGSVLLRNGVDLVARVVNKVTPNTTLTKAAYQAVRVSGAQGQRLAIELAQANNDAGSADTIGLVTETIAPNQEGFIMTVGQLEGINTTGSLQGETWVDGDVLYLSPTTAGAITNVKPTGATGHLVIIGYVEYAHANNGKLYIKVMNGFELAELHDTSIVTPANNQGLFYNSSNSLWENKSITTALGYTPVPTTRNITINGVTYDLSADRTWTIAAGISGSGASGQVTYWTGASAVSGSNNLFWDNANSRLGIGTNAPVSSVHIELPIASNGSQGFYVRKGTGVFFAGNGTSTASNFLPFFSAVANFDASGLGFLGQAFNTTTSNPAILFQAANNGATATIGNSQIALAVSNLTTRLLNLYGTGNLLLQNGGTFTDSGERLQVTGTMKVTGNVAVDTNTLFVNTANKRIGVRTTTPGSAVDVWNNGTTETGQYRLSDSRVTIPTYTTIFDPPLTTNTLGYYAPFSGSTGGVAFVGFTSNTNAGTPFAFIGYHGGTSPTTATLRFLGFKHDGSTGRTALTGNEIIAGFAAGTGADVFQVKANGRINMSSLPTSSTGLATGDLWNDAGTIKIV